MAKEIILSKESSTSEIQAYFNAVLKLSQSDNEFPINLDEVWMLVYPRKDHTVRALTSNEQFIENVDYKSFPKNGEQDSNNGWGGNNKVDYYLTVSCMEFFIARKVRPVFEVYRKVFHHTVQKAIESKPKPKREPSLMQQMKIGVEWVRNVSDILNLNDASKLTLLGKVAKPLELPMPDYVPSHGALKSATDLLKERKTQISAREFNTIAMQKRILCELERRTSHGQKAKFKSITKEGLKYGENQVNPNNPKSTQPQWYADKFDELLKVLGFQSSEELPYENN